MNSKTWLIGAIAASVSLIPILGENVTAQQSGRRCVNEQESCAYDEYPQYNQRLNYRTIPQIYQRRVNIAEKVCDSSNIMSCNQVAPQIQMIQETDTLQQLRDRQIQEVEQRR